MNGWLHLEMGWLTALAEKDQIVLFVALHVAMIPDMTLSSQ